MIIVLQTLIFFRESLFKAVDRILRPYYKHLYLPFYTVNADDDLESDEHVFSEFDDEKGVVFYPPVYAQRYAAVSDCLMDERWNGKLEKIVDLGYHDMSFIKYLKEVPGVRKILGVDLETMPLRCSSDLLNVDDYAPKRENPLQITLLHGNAADPDFRLIGCDAVVAIEMIEHMYPQDLERLVHTVFGFIRPWVAIFTTPNGDFNVLFKALEKNGLRRLDHFFEWSREQFNDWCSNIVVRYPGYSVSCRGIGPGPPGTLYLGCCSQMAVFVAKDYHKQEELNINSLALIPDIPSAAYSEFLSSMETPVNVQDPMICQNSGFLESLSELPVSLRQSHATILLSPSFSGSLPTEYKDKISQCNLEIELGKSFLMFDNEQLFNIVIPRVRVTGRVYVIEDVSSRLNCSTLQVRKFSKTTHNLMAKNKIDTLVHTREVVDEIRHLTKSLKFSGGAVNQFEGGFSWQNINWGDNAPYWNQYYKIIKEYNYPFETKSEDCRILDLISEEINRLVDTQYDEDSVEGQLEIPLERLMDVVAHITDDIDKVKDLLEWNGYEVINDVVIYSRLVVDSSATHDDDWQDKDTFSDWDTAEVSTGTTEASTFIPDYSGRCLRRALDQKVRNLRAMMSIDEDFTTELDRVVCRLMKLALRSSRGRLTPPPARWMQYKLLDLLSLTEKAIERRKRHFIESYPVKAIEYEVSKPLNVSAYEKIKDDTAGTYIVDKYRHILDTKDNVDDILPQDTDCNDFDFISMNSREFEVPFDMPIERDILVDPIALNERETKLERVQAWVEEELEMVPYTHETNTDITSENTEQSPPVFKHKYKRAKKQRKVENIDESHIEVYKISKSKFLYEKRRIKREKSSKKGNSIKNMSKKKACYRILVKNSDEKYLYKVKTEETQKAIANYSYLHTTVPKPIPESLIELGNLQPFVEKDSYLAVNDLKTDLELENNKLSNQYNGDIAATKESLLVNIVMEEQEETIALRRTLGTDAGESTTFSDSNTLIQNDSKELFNRHYVSTENFESQTIFLNDINEPSTSKGIRHVSMDVQCGPDVDSVYPAPSPAASFTDMHKTSPTEHQIKELLTNIKNNDPVLDKPTLKQCEALTPRIRSVGIKIRDSCVAMEMIEYPVKEPNVIETVTKDKQDVPNNFELIKKSHIASTKDCLPNSDNSPVKAGFSVTANNDLCLECIDQNENVNKSCIDKYYSTKYIRPTLCHGGVCIHSYKDKQTCEDVVFHGEWQKSRPKNLTPKKGYNQAVTMKIVTPIKKKKEINESNTANESNKRITNLYKTRQMNNLSNINGNVSPNNSMKIPYKNIKVATRLTTSVKPTKSEMLRSRKYPTTLNRSDNDKFPKACINDLPNYLKSNKENSPNRNKLNKTLESSPTAKKVNINQTKSLVKKQVNNITKTLLEFPDEPRPNLDYIVFCNGIDDNKDNTGEKSSPSNRNDTNKRNNYANRKTTKVKHVVGNQSPNSSTCSSPNSVATVRPNARNTSRSMSGRRHSTPPYKSNGLNSESDSSSPTKVKIPLRKYKNTKMNDNNAAADNKENVLKSLTLNTSDDNKLPKTPFMMRHENIYIAELQPESSRKIPEADNLSKCHNRTQPKVSDILIPVPVDTVNNEKSLNKSRDESTDGYSNISQGISNYCPIEQSNVVLVLEPNQTLLNTSENFITNTQGIKSESESIQKSFTDITDSDDVALSMRKIVEEVLEFLDMPFDDIDSETVILSRNDENESFYTDMSPQSFKTVITNDDFENTESILETALNLTFDTSFGSDSIFSANDTVISMNDLDNSSIKCPSSTKYSDYYLAENEMRAKETEPVNTAHSNSVQDIFERKEIPIQNTPGALALQAFSEFSLLTEPLIGDGIDPVSIIDSETGSGALDTGRQATSEELFISGRSSDSYESCLIDEDAVVPNWLFNIISHQQSEVSDVSDQQTVPPLAEPLYDANGNMMEPVVGVGAGAGDGRGIHSDRSQDSSGRGSSLSSSEVSSEPQSEAILIDPSILTNEYDLPLDSINGLRAESTSEVSEHPTRPSNSHWHRPVRALLNASDVDADISSVDTDDLPDSATDLN